MAADSVGEAQPSSMLPTTAIKMPNSGTTSRMNGFHLAHPATRSPGSSAGASEGAILQRRATNNTKRTANSPPGTMPPMSSCDMEMPARLPSMTASAEGGISMAMPPTAMMGPMAILG